MADSPRFCLGACWEIVRTQTQALVWENISPSLIPPALGERRGFLVNGKTFLATVLRKKNKSMEKIPLIVTSTFGLEALVKREVKALGFHELIVADGKVEFPATVADIPRLNISLRTADRVLLKLGEFLATDFGQLFDQTKTLAWEEWITKDAQITVIGKSVKSTLRSVRSCQSIVKKAIVERLKVKYQTGWLSETGPEFTIQVAVLNDVVQLTIDTSGKGLHKRGYRAVSGEVPLRENLAAALVLLSSWDKDKLLIDPMCGSGTILIEAALLARNIAPGLNREFAAENWPGIRKISGSRPGLWPARRFARKGL